MEFNIKIMEAKPNKNNRSQPTSQSDWSSSVTNIRFENKNDQRDHVLVNLKSCLPKLDRGLRKHILRKYPSLKKLFHCTSKYQLRNILFELPSDIKKILQRYMQQCFIFHLHIRPISDINQLLKQRKVIYEAISNPDVLNGNKSFGNNLIKNFCKGVVNFVVTFYHDLVKKRLLQSDKNQPSHLKN